MLSKAKNFVKDVFSYLLRLFSYNVLMQCYFYIMFVLITHVIFLPCFMSLNILKFEFEIYI